MDSPVALATWRSRSFWFMTMTFAVSETSNEKSPGQRGWGFRYKSGGTALLRLSDWADAGCKVKRDPSVPRGLHRCARAKCPNAAAKNPLLTRLRFELEELRGERGAQNRASALDRAALQ